MNQILVVTFKRAIAVIEKHQATTMVWNRGLTQSEVCTEEICSVVFKMITSLMGVITLESFMNLFIYSFSPQITKGLKCIRY